jgi:hypothetical protein
VPDKVTLNNKVVNTLTKTSNPTRRKGEQSIKLKASNKVDIPVVSVNVDKPIANPKKLINTLEKQINASEKVIDKLEDKVKRQTKKKEEPIKQVQTYHDDTLKKFYTKIKFYEDEKTKWENQEEEIKKKYGLKGIVPDSRITNNYYNHYPEIQNILDKRMAANIALQDIKAVKKQYTTTKKIDSDFFDRIYREYYFTVKNI